MLRLKYFENIHTPSCQAVINSLPSGISLLIVSFLWLTAWAIYMILTPIDLIVFTVDE